MNKFDTAVNSIMNEAIVKSMRDNDIQRLQQIKNEIKELVIEATLILRRDAPDMVYERAKSYWIGHISTALDDESDYMGTSQVTFQNTIDELGVSNEDVEGTFDNIGWTKTKEELEQILSDFDLTLDSFEEVDDEIKHVVISGTLGNFKHFYDTHINNGLYGPYDEFNVKTKDEVFTAK